MEFWVHLLNHLKRFWILVLLLQFLFFALLWLMMVHLVKINCLLVIRTRPFLGSSNFLFILLFHYKFCFPDHTVIYYTNDIHTSRDKVRELRRLFIPFCTFAEVHKLLQSLWCKLDKLQWTRSSVEPFSKPFWETNIFFTENPKMLCGL